MENIPKIIFIVPYRDRLNDRKIFEDHMKYILEDYDSKDYKIFFSHQCDNRSFNRGACKNIGFAVIRRLYPNHYKNMTFVFNDVDTLPKFKNQLNYETKLNNIKHFYGYDFALGGIVSIKGSDFEKMNGYQNLWGWGLEDNGLQIRALANKINIDRSIFFKPGHPHIRQSDRGTVRYKETTYKQYEKYKSTIVVCGLNTIYNVSYDIVNQDINIRYFDDKILRYSNEIIKTKDLAQGNTFKPENNFKYRGQIKMRF